MPNYLQESDYRGVDPAQMLQLAANERANKTFEFNAASSLASQKKQTAQLMQDNAQFNREMQLKAITTHLKAQKDKKAADLAQQRFTVNAAYTKALTTQSKLTIDKLKADRDKLIAKEEKLASYSGMMFDIVGYSEPVSALDIMFLKENKVDVQFKGNAKLKTLVIDPKTKDIHGIMTDRTTGVIEGLRGMRAKPFNSNVTNINLSPKDRAIQTTEGRITANLKDPKYLPSIEKELQADISYWQQSTSREPDAKEKARQMKIDRVLKDVIPLVRDGSDVTYIEGKGFFAIKKDKNGKYIVGKRYVGPLDD